MIWMPAIVIRDHRDRRIAKLCLAGQFSFGHIGHADHIRAPAFAVHLGLGQRAELRAFHRQIGTATVHIDASVARSGFARVTQARAGGVRYADMGHAAGAKERLFPRNGPVDELVYDDKITRCHFIAERPAGRHTDHIRAAQPFERVDIGAVGDGRGRMHMPAAVARQKGHVDPVERAGQDRVGWRAPRAFHGKPLGPLQAIDIIDAGAADHGDFRLCHEGAFGLSWRQSIKRSY